MDHERHFKDEAPWDLYKYDILHRLYVQIWFKRVSR